MHTSLLVCPSLSYPPTPWGHQACGNLVSPPVVLPLGPPSTFRGVAPPCSGAPPPVADRTPWSLLGSTKIIQISKSVSRWLKRSPNPSQNPLRMVTNEISKAALQKNKEMSIRPIIYYTSSTSTTQNIHILRQFCLLKPVTEAHRDESVKKRCSRQPPSRKNAQKGLQDGPRNVSRAVANSRLGP